MCSKIAMQNGNKTLKLKHQKEFQRIYEQLAGYGERVLALAYLPLDLDPKEYGVVCDEWRSKQKKEIHHFSLPFETSLSLQLQVRF
jgi:hypothetical protein